MESPSQLWTITEGSFDVDTAADAAPPDEAALERSTATSGAEAEAEASGEALNEKRIGPSRDAEAPGGRSSPPSGPDRTVRDAVPKLAVIDTDESDGEIYSAGEMEMDPRRAADEAAKAGSAVVLSSTGSSSALNEKKDISDRDICGRLYAEAAEREAKRAGAIKASLPDSPRRAAKAGVTASNRLYEDAKEKKKERELREQAEREKQAAEESAATEKAKVLAAKARAKVMTSADGADGVASGTSHGVPSSLNGKGGHSDKDVCERLYSEAAQREKKRADAVKASLPESPQRAAQAGVTASNRLYENAQEKRKEQQMREAAEREKEEAEQMAAKAKAKVITTEEATGLYRKLMEKKEEAEKKKEQVASSLKPSFQPKLMANKSTKKSGYDRPDVGVTTDSRNLVNRLYEPEYMSQREERLQQTRRAIELKNCTFSPETNESVRSPRSSGSVSSAGTFDSSNSAVWERLYEKGKEKTRAGLGSPEKEDYTFKPDLSRTRRRHSGAAGEEDKPVYERLHERSTAPKRNQQVESMSLSTAENNKFNVQEAKLGSRSPSGVNNRRTNDSRTEAMYRDGVLKVQSRGISHSDEELTRRERKEKEELSECTFRPKMDWKRDTKSHVDVKHRNTRESTNPRESTGGAVVKHSATSPKRGVSSKLYENPRSVVVNSKEGTPKSDDGAIEGGDHRKGTNRLDQLYYKGLQKSRDTARSHKVEEEARRKRLENEELASCTFRPKMDWKKKNAAKKSSRSEASRSDASSLTPTASLSYTDGVGDKKTPEEDELDEILNSSNEQVSRREEPLLDNEAEPTWAQSHNPHVTKTKPTAYEKCSYGNETKTDAAPQSQDVASPSRSNVVKSLRPPDQSSTDDDGEKGKESDLSNRFSRLEEMYNKGVEKSKARHMTNREEEEARKKRLEEAELQKCTFEPRMDWKNAINSSPPDEVQLRPSDVSVLGLGSVISANSLADRETVCVGVETKGIQSENSTMPRKGGQHSISKGVPDTHIEGTATCCHCIIS